MATYHQGKYCRQPSCQECEDNRLREAALTLFKACGWFIFWLILAFLVLCGPAHAYVDQGEAIKAIIGESEGEIYAGKLAVAEVIRRRGSLKGVYGAKAPRVIQRLYSKACYLEAARAWAESESTNISEGAMGWGSAADVKIFRRSKWFKNCEIVKQIGGHYFWRVKK
jgi:hypothetical protein